MESKQDASNISTERTLGRLESMVAGLKDNADAHEEEATRRHLENVAKIEGVSRDVATNHDVVVSLTDRIKSIETSVAVMRVPVDALIRAQKRKAFIVGMVAACFTALIEVIHYSDLVIDSVLHLRDWLR